MSNADTGSMLAVPGRLQSNRPGNASPSRTIGVAPALWLGGIPLAFLLGWITTKGFGLQLVAVMAVVGIPFVTVRTRWATAFAMAPALLYPVSALTSVKVLGTLNVAPLMAGYLLVNVVLMYIVRPRTTTPSTVGLAGLLMMIGASILESAHSGNGTLSHFLTTGTFWLSAFFLGSLMAEDSQQFITLGFCALPLAGLAVWQAATGSNPYNHLIGPLHFASVETHENLQRSTSTFGHPLVAGACLTILAFSAIASRRRLAMLVAPLVLLGAVATVSRSALIGAALAFVVVLAQRGAKRSLVVTVGLIAAVALISVATFPRLATSLEGRVLNSSSNEVARTTGPKVLLHDLSTEPLAVAFGEGIGTTSKDFAATGGIAGVDTYDNQFIDTTLDIGFLPFIAALLLLGYALFHARSDSRRVFLPVVVGSIAMLLFFDGLTWSSFAVLFWLMYGALTSEAVTDDARTGDQARADKLTPAPLGAR
jgi:hypothetical protein